MPATLTWAQIGLSSDAHVDMGSASLHATGPPMPQLAVTGLPS